MKTWVPVAPGRAGSEPGRVRASTSWSGVSSFIEGSSFIRDALSIRDSSFIKDSPFIRGSLVVGNPWRGKPGSSSWDWLP